MRAHLFLALFMALFAVTESVQAQTSSGGTSPVPGSSGEGSSDDPSAGVSAVPGASGATTMSASLAIETPAIDGRDDDPAWLAAFRQSAFVQHEPDNRAAPTLPTEFSVTYDERNLYVYVRAWDPHPDSIPRALTRRDVRGPSDEISILIDSYHDRRTGYWFAVNPDGVKRDAALANDGNEDWSWNGIWEVGTLVDGEGWAAEFQIPLSQLRYADAPEHTFGLAVVRMMERYRETVTWPAIDRNRPGLVSQFGEISGLRRLTNVRSIEVTPYTVAKNESREVDDAKFDRASRLSLGADLKLRLTPNITIDATVNPDFGQVEADPAVLNLSAFETFLGERRPFFLEGTGLYRFALNCYAVVDCGTNEGLFYSRRIGRAPSLRSDHGLPDTPATTPIAAASKVTGRTGSGLSFGVLHALTPRVEGADEVTIEPLTNFAVVSAEQDFREGDAGIRLLATSVTRSLDDLTEETMHASAQAVGLNGRSRLFGGNYEVVASAAASRVAGTPDAIARTQRNAVHYFQQPDDDAEYDPTRDSLTGHSLHLRFGKYGGGITRFETSLARSSAGFDVNDLGYLRRADQADWSTWMSLRFNDPGRYYRWAQLNANHWETWTTSGRRLQNAINLNGHVGLHNNWDAHLGATLDGLGEAYCDRCSRGGPAVRTSTGFHPWFGLNTDSRRLLAPSIWVNLGFNHEGRTRNVSLNPQLAINASTALQARLGVNWSRNDDDVQWVENVEDPDGSIHHSFARLEQETLSFSVRLNYTAAPDLTFEFYGQPFVSTGTYSDFRELSPTPDAEAYLDRYMPFTPPESTDTELRVRQVRTNAVMRWEFRPGSTLFLVWAHGREASDVDGRSRSWGDEYRDLLELRPEHTFLIKLAYWFNR